MKNSKILFLVKGAVIAALYTALTLAFAPISYGMLQVRVSEALTILPLFTPAAIPGLLVGCLISNAVGIATSVNPIGVIDLVVGSGATLAAAVLTYVLRNVKFLKIPLLSFLSPIVINALLVGLELSFILSTPFIIHALWVGLGEILAVGVLGTVLYTVLIKTKASKFLQSTQAGYR